MDTYDWYVFQEKTIFNKHVWMIGLRVGLLALEVGAMALVSFGVFHTPALVWPACLILVGATADSIGSYIGDEMRNRKYSA